ncbi:hypothetical protein ACTOB_003433 [Actinoplanes oblitus]|uniref:PASTA domain-containing protein n=1 Tax=Actinoplanes oblitus TaxID=3040509 RepID=A0ABY8WPG6_9ACTN|nr:hypothetical protein [Actinoplanes oblitus]WIM99771.1 hypothetical protein ACTOB_003433 [Actinoplanes oblitus]
MGSKQAMFLGWAAALVTAGVALAGCGTISLEGENPASEAEQAAKRLNDDLGYRDRLREAEYIAATEVPTAAQGSDSEVSATPLAWSGRVFADEKATIDVRFAVRTRDSEPTDGTTWCYRYTLELYRYTSYDEIDCPAVASPPAPSASPPLKLPDDAPARLAAALRDATPETLADRVRTAFPQDGIGVDTVTDKGTLVAAVGVAAERDCLVMIRKPDGKTMPVAFRPVQLEPGETGCRTSLYTHPAQ